jgi:hypothetical protein
MVEADEQCVTDSYKARLSLPSLTTMEGQPILLILLFHQDMLPMTRDHLHHLTRHLLRSVSRLPMTDRRSEIYHADRRNCLSKHRYRIVRQSFPKGLSAVLRQHRWPLRAVLLDDTQDHAFGLSTGYRERFQEPTLRDFREISASHPLRPQRGRRDGVPQ